MATNKKASFWQKRLASIQFALAGLRYVFITETNIQVHTITSVFVLALAYFFDVNRLDWISILLCIGLVFVAEILNTAIERLADFVSPGIHPQIKIVKDIAAGAVFFSALIALAVACFIFVPKLASLF